MRHLCLPASCLAVVVCIGCSGAAGLAVPDAAPKEETSDHAEQIAAREMEVTIEEFQAGVEFLRKRVDRLRETYGALPAGPQAEFGEQVEHLGNTLRNAEEQLARLPEADHETQHEGRRSLQETLDHLDEACRKLAETFADL